MSEFITPYEAARILHVEQSTLRRWYGQGRLTDVEVYHTAGGQRRYRRSDIERFALAPPVQRAVATASQQLGVEDPSSWDDDGIYGNGLALSASHVTPVPVVERPHSGYGPSTYPQAERAPVTISRWVGAIDHANLVRADLRRSAKQLREAAEALMLQPGIATYEEPDDEDQRWQELAQWRMETTDAAEALGWTVRDSGVLVCEKAFYDGREALEDAEMLSWHGVMIYELDDTSVHTRVEIYLTVGETPEYRLVRR